MTETRVTVELQDAMTFLGTDEAGLSIAMDAAADSGGRGLGPSPMRVLAMALGGCTGMDVIAMLRKMRQDVTAYRVNVGGPRAETHPQVFTAMAVEHVVQGRGLNVASVHRAIELSATRYCPASAMLGKATTVTHAYRVLDEAGAEVGAGSIVAGEALAT